MPKDEFVEEPQEGAQQDWLGAGLCVLTTGILIVAFILVEITLGNLYGVGLFK